MTLKPFVVGNHRGVNIAGIDRRDCDAFFPDLFEQGLAEAPDSKLGRRVRGLAGPAGQTGL